MLMRQKFFLRGIRRKLSKKREFIENDVLLSQFMLCQNINKYNNGLCKSGSSYKERWNVNRKIDENHMNTSAHEINKLTLTLTLNASLLCMVKQPNLKLEPVACVYYKVIGAWWISAHPWEVRDRVCLAKQVSVRFAGNLALISCTRPRTHPSLARVPEGLIRSYGRRSAGYQMLIMRSRMLTYPPSQPLFALVTQRSLSNAGERALRDETKQWLRRRLQCALTNAA